MHEIPTPTHGYVPVIVAFWVYVALVLGITVGARALGAPEGVVLVVFVLVAVALLRVFVPVFRRFTPSLGTDE